MIMKSSMHKKMHKKKKLKNLRVKPFFLNKA